MRRRRFVLTSLAGVLAAPLAAGAQQVTGRVWKIGFLGGSPAVVGSLIQAFEQGLRDLGYVKGRKPGAVRSRARRGSVTCKFVLSSLAHCVQRN